MLKTNKLFILIALFLFISCKEEGVIYSTQRLIPKQIWNSKDTLVYNFNIKDTIKHYDIYLNMRNSSSYKWSNIYIFSDLKFPNDSIRRDTTHFYLTDIQGRWLGTNSGTIIDNTLPIFKNKRFPLIGDYSLTIEQAMRDLELKEVINVGIKIKETSNNK